MSDSDIQGAVNGTGSPAFDSEHQRLDRHSIDMMIELEHQLARDDGDEDYLPASASAAGGKKSRPVSLDPHVLTAIIANLRHSLADMSKERDHLLGELALSHAQTAEAKNSNSELEEKCTDMQAELTTLRTKAQQDDETIAMLRIKVEESRRGLMRLQTENRRVSHISNLTLDTQRASLYEHNGPPTSNRASFVPLTGSRINNNHRRVSSVSDSAFILGLNGGHVSAEPSGEHSHGPPSPNFQAQHVQDADTVKQAKSSRRVSSFFPSSSSMASNFGAGGTSPPRHLDLLPNPLLPQLESLKGEVSTLKTQLEETRHELAESIEAKEASELCVNALRNFIAENAIGEQRERASNTKKVTAPPQTSSGSVNGDAPARKPTAGWGGFKLWNTGGAAKEPATSPPVPDVPLPVPQAGPSNTNTTPPSQFVPLTHKLGGFFNSRASVSSVSSGGGASATGNPRDSNSRVPHYLSQEPVYNGTGSDCSSMDESEPISPETSIVMKEGEEVVVRSNSGEIRSLSSVLNADMHGALGPKQGMSPPPATAVLARSD